MTRSILSLVIVLIASTSALAEPEVRVAKTQDEMRPHVGLLAGTAKNKSGEFAFHYGIDVGFQPLIPFSLGLQLSHYEYTDVADHAVTPILVKGTYNLSSADAPLQAFYIGAKTGAVLFKTSIGGVSDTATKFAIGPNVGADFSVMPQITIGPEVSYLVVIDDAPNMMQAQALFKYWF